MSDGYGSDYEGLPLFTLSQKGAKKTSRDAVAGIRGLGGMRLQVLRLFQEFGEIDGEVLEDLCLERYDWPLNKSTARARRSDLKRLGMIRDSGRLNKNKNGCKVIIWEITDMGAREQI
jgi:hypothetical protein